MDGEEYGMQVWQAGESALAGIYLRVDDHSYRTIVLEQPGLLPASYDGHIAHYCRAPAMCLLNAQPEKCLAEVSSQQASEQPQKAAL